MPEKWTGEIVGRMHVDGFSMLQLAETLGWHPKYLSAVMHGHRSPAGAEQKVREALKKMEGEQ